MRTYGPIYCLIIACMACFTYTPQSPLDYKSGSFTLGWATWKLLDQATHVFADSAWYLNRLNNKFKFIHHEDLTAIQQPGISCWLAYGVATLLSSVESVFFKERQSVRHLANTHTTEYHLQYVGFMVSSRWCDCSYFCWTYTRRRMGQVLSFIESDLIRDRYTKSQLQDVKYLLKIYNSVNNSLQLYPALLFFFKIKDIISETFLVAKKIIYIFLKGGNTKAALTRVVVEDI